MLRRETIIILLGLALLVPGLDADAARIKDIVTVSGADGEHLIGYGIVVGLAGTGDGSKTGFTNHSITSMMEKFGHTLDPNEIKLKNVAAVMVTAGLWTLLFLRGSGEPGYTLGNSGWMPGKKLGSGICLTIGCLRISMLCWEVYGG